MLPLAGATPSANSASTIFLLRLSCSRRPFDLSEFPERYAQCCDLVDGIDRSCESSIPPLLLASEPPLPTLLLRRMGLFLAPRRSLLRCDEPVRLLRSKRPDQHIDCDSVRGPQLNRHHSANVKGGSEPVSLWAASSGLPTARPRASRRRMAWAAAALRCAFDYADARSSRACAGFLALPSGTA
jgi:hypothetical protein